MEFVVVLEFVGLLMLIVAAAALLSHGTEAIAERYGANFTGSIVLAMITTLPEYMFVIWACVKTRYDMAVGSAVGRVLFSSRWAMDRSFCLPRRA